MENVDPAAVSDDELSQQQAPTAITIAGIHQNDLDLTVFHGVATFESFLTGDTNLTLKDLIVRPLRQA